MGQSPEKTSSGITQDMLNSHSSEFDNVGVVDNQGNSLETQRPGFLFWTGHVGIPCLVHNPNSSLQKEHPCCS